MVCLVWTWVQNISNDHRKITVGRTMYGEFPNGDAGPGRGTVRGCRKEEQNGEACGVKEDKQ